MIAEIEELFYTYNLHHFIKKYKKHPLFGDAIKKWAEELEKKTGRTFRGMLQKGLWRYTERSDEEEIENILRKAKGIYLVHYDEHLGEIEILKLKEGKGYEIEASN